MWCMIIYDIKSIYIVAHCAGSEVLFYYLQSMYIYIKIIINSWFNKNQIIYNNVYIWQFLLKSKNLTKLTLFYELQ